MNRIAAQKLIDEWKRESSFMLEENGEFFFNIYLPIDYVEKINFHLLDENINFDTFIIDCELAYLIDNKLSEEVFPITYTALEIRDFIDKEAENSPYKDRDDYIMVYITNDVEGVHALTNLLELERAKNPLMTFDDLFVKFIDSYEKFDPDLLKSLLDRMDEEDDENKKKN